MFRRLTAALVVGGSCVALAACGSDDSGSAGNGKGPIKIGGVLALTGPAAPFGTRQAAAAEETVKEINANGGINGRKLEFILRDSKTDATEAVRVANQLIADEGVIAIFGAATGSETLSFVNAAMRAKVPVVPPTATAEVTDPDKPYTDWVFRNAPYGEDSYPFFFKKMADDGAKRIAVFYQEDAYGQAGLRLLQDAAKKDGRAQVVASVSAPLDASDITAQIKRLLNSRPDALFSVTSAPALSGTVLRTADRLGFDGTVYGAEGAGQRAVIKAAQGRTDNFVAPVIANPDDPDSMAELNRMMADRGGIEGYGELLGANGIAIIVAGLEKGADTGEELRKAIESAGPIDGYGAVPMQFAPDDHNGYPPEMYSWARVVDGKFVAEDDLDQPKS